MTMFRRQSLFTPPRIGSMPNWGLPARLLLLAIALGGTALTGVQGDAGPNGDAALAKAWRRAQTFDVSAMKEALAGCRLTLGRAEDAGDKRLAARAMARLGLIQAYYGRYDEARAVCLQAQARCQALGEAAMSARLLQELARIFDVTGANSQAVDYYERALAAFRALDDRHGEAETLALRAAHLSQQGEMAAARRDSERAKRIATSLNQPDLTARVAYHQSLIWIREGRYREAADIYKRILPQAAASGDRYLEAKIANNLGWTQNALGEPDQAVRNLSRAATLYERAAHPELGACCLSLGELKATHGETRAAMKLFFKARDIFKRAGSPNAEASVLYRLGKTQWNLGDASSASSFYERAHELFAAIGNRNAAAMVLMAMGEMHLEQDRLEPAREALDRALAIARAIENREKTARALAALGELSVREGDLETALCLFDRALPLQRAQDMRLAEVRTLRALGHAHLASREPGLALPLFEEALALIAPLRAPQERALSLHELARLFAGAQSLEDALAYNQLALDAIGSLRAQIAGLTSRVAYANRTHELYAFHIELLTAKAKATGDQSWAEKAFLVSERSRGRTLAETFQLFERGENGRPHSALARRRSALQQRLQALIRRQTEMADRGGEPNDLEALDREIDDLLAEQRLLDARLQAENPRYAALSLPAPRALTDIRASLNHTTALLEYSLGESSSALWLVTANAFQAFALPSEAALAPLTERLFDALTARNEVIPFETTLERRRRVAASDALWAEFADDLSATILAPALAALPDGIERLAIAADGSLLYLPFAALPLPEGGQPLLSAYTVVNTPSATTAAAIREAASRRARAKKTLAAFGDPVFEKNDPRVGRESLMAADEAQAVRGAPPGRFRRLPYTKREVEAIAALAPAEGRLQALGHRATRAAVLSEELGNYRMLHFATHGAVDPRRPDLSYLVFSLYDAAGLPIDGVLTRQDIDGFSLRADLVTLSACQTAFGREARGEGLMSLAQGFMFAGAPRVVASLWRVQDEATAELMTRFYRNMLEGGQPAETALRQAQLDIRNETAWREPYFWAGFVHHGYWELARDRR